MCRTTSHARAVSTRSLAWENLAAPPALESDQIHLWLVDVSHYIEEHGLTASRGSLSAREFHRAGRIIDDDKRQLYVGGRIGLRQLLQAYTGIAAAEISFNYGERGKPWLEFTTDTGSLEFNYTVSSGYALYAFAAGIELGVDLEIFPRAIHSEGFVRRILSATELDCWNQVPVSQQEEAMLACWTRKEAYGKLLGVGIRYNMHQVSLFTGLHSDAWCSGIQGLFEGELPVNFIEACGVQVELPVSGAATVMYGTSAFAVNERGSRSKIAPQVLAYVFQPAGDNV